MKLSIHNIVLIGFMGTGKSTVGRALARKLGWALVDLDREVERADGRRIAEIFEQEGEPFFREQERSALQQAASGRNQVIACGGGIVTVPGNKALLEESGTVICLRATPDTIWERVSRNRNRPLLQVADPRTRILELLAERQPFYDAFDCQIDTDGKTTRQIADTIIALLS